jgi:hypothetical protein
MITELGTKAKRFGMMENEDPEKWMISQMKKVDSLMSDSCNQAQLLKKELEKLIKEITNDQNLDIIELDCGEFNLILLNQKLKSSCYYCISAKSTCLV